MRDQHEEPGVVTAEEVLLRWPLIPVARHLIPDEAHEQAVEFKKQSASTPEQIEDLMQRHNDGADLDRYFERRIEMLELDWEKTPTDPGS